MGLGFKLLVLSINKQSGCCICLLCVETGGNTFYLVYIAKLPVVTEVQSGLEYKELCGVHASKVMYNWRKKMEPYPNQPHGWKYSTTLSPVVKFVMTISPGESIQVRPNIRLLTFVIGGTESTTTPGLFEGHPCPAKFQTWLYKKLLPLDYWKKIVRI